MVELCTELFYAILFPCFLPICYPYILCMFFSLVLRLALANHNNNHDLCQVYKY